MRTVERMEITSKEEAKARGLHRFYTGKPCKHGHNSERYVSSKGCVTCLREYSKKRAMELRLSRLEHRLAQIERGASGPKHKNRHTGTGLTIEKNREERNGVKRPSAGGKCRAVWDALDRDVEAGQQPDAKRVKELADANGWNPNNAAIEFYQWRKFNGINGRRAA